jgi:DNA-directed RNA polymerase II subunit RPB2
MEHLVKAAIGSYFNIHGLASHQLESFEHYVHTLIPRIITENSPIDVMHSNKTMYHRIIMSGIYIQSPTVKEVDGLIRKLTPKEAIMRRLTYTFDIFINLEHLIYKQKVENANEYVLTEHIVYTNVLLCSIPCMVNSTPCSNHDKIGTTVRETGVFIINGFEKCVISQEKLMGNYPYVFTVNRKSKFSFKCEIRSCHPCKIRSTSTLHIYITDTPIPEIMVVVPFIKQYIPMRIIFHLLGVTSISNMVYYLTCTSTSISPVLRQLITAVSNTESMDINGMDNDDLYDWIGLKGTTTTLKLKRIQYIKHIFDNEFLPHCDNSTGIDVSIQKAHYLGYSIRKLLKVSIHELSPDDIDSYCFKRTHPVGYLNALQLRQRLRVHIKMIKVQLFRSISNDKYINAVDFFTHTKLSSGIKYSYATGNWGTNNSCMNTQSGICQIINSMNYVAKTSHLRQINSPINRDGKLSLPRQLHNTHFGILCAAETPEGKSAGLINNLSLLARIRIAYPIEYITRILYNEMNVLPLQTTSTDMLQNCTGVFVNGMIIGCCLYPIELTTIYRKYRQWHDVPIDSSITYLIEHQEIRINTDVGDCYRPLINISNIHKWQDVHIFYGEYPHILWSQLLIEGVIEYISKTEEQELLICITIEQYETNKLTSKIAYTHLEICPSMSLYGISAGVIAFSNQNQGTTVLYV